MWLTRSLGISLHPTSLPGGRLGAEAFAFVDWLVACGARWWQVMPLGPPDEHGSPYTSRSAFACSAGLLADPDARVQPSELRSFERRHAAWAGDWATYAGEGALADQVRFEREWAALRTYAAGHGVSIIGDVPIYVAGDSCDHAAHPEIFLPGDLVAGVPPDALNAAGQLWGNPLFDWDELARTGYGWWVERVRRVLELVDALRIDHFRGFSAYWAVPAGAATARAGHWRRGPGAALFLALERALGRLPVIVEDLGMITPDVAALRDELGYPGMAVLLWAFSGAEDNPHRLANHRPNQVVYTSTHDTETLAGAFPGQDSWSLVELALSSRANLAVLPLQDVLGLGNDARINHPGTQEGNWRWRLEPGRPDRNDAARLRRAAEAAGRA